MMPDSTLQLLFYLTFRAVAARPQKLYISVRDENDHAPVFLQDNVEIQMPEEMEVGSLVGYVFAQDDDIGEVTGSFTAI